MDKIIFTVLTLFIITSIIFLIIERGKYKKFKESFDQKDKYINELYKEIEIQSEEKIKLHDRVIELEDMKGEALQVKLRNEITEVHVNFTKLEVVVLSAGVRILLKRTNNPDDAKVYIALIDKIKGFIDHMKEEGYSQNKG